MENEAFVLSRRKEHSHFYPRLWNEALQLPGSFLCKARGVKNRKIRIFPIVKFKCISTQEQN